jgi:ABC-type hemin transport system substrate-binding protein
MYIHMGYRLPKLYLHNVYPHGLSLTQIERKNILVHEVQSRDRFNHTEMQIRSVAAILLLQEKKEGAHFALSVRRISDSV